MRASHHDPSEGQTNAARPPAHQVIYTELRARILFGDLVPGQPVTIQGLAQQLGAGMTPIREAIRRLTAEGALEFQGNRRVSVPILTADHIEELIVARTWLDPHLTLRAAARMTKDGIQDLTALDTALDQAIRDEDLRTYLEHNYLFHTRVYQMAEAPILADLAEGLWLRFGPSLRVVCGRMGTQNLPDKHKEMLAALNAGDAKAAADAMGEDVVQGMEQVRRALLAAEI